MLSQKKIASLGYCRRCINQVYHVHLERQDVMVYPSVYECRKCGMVRNIVAEVPFFRRWKLFLAHK